LSNAVALGNCSWSQTSLRCRNDPGHLRHFLKNLKTWGLTPKATCCFTRRP
jgi:hypothetical protein